MLRVSISPDSFASGKTFTMNTEVFNTLSSVNNVSGNTDWPLPSLVGQCPGGIINRAFYKGHVTTSNISFATALSEYGPGETSCPAYQKQDYYSFAPRSDIVTSTSSYPVTVTATSCTTITYSPTKLSNGSTITPVSGGCSEMPSTSTTTTQFSFNASSSFSDGQGYYNPSVSSFMNFPSGQYSYVVGDIWNDYVILYFTVS